MSTLTEIEAAVNELPVPQQGVLFALLAGKLGRASKRVTGLRKKLDSAAYPALEGLPTDLSVGTKDRVRTAVEKRHAADR